MMSPLERASLRAVSRKSLLVSDPQLKLMTRAPCFRAKSMLLIMVKLDVKPLSSKTRMGMMRLWVPDSDLKPVGFTTPAAIRAICVPCPRESEMNSSGSKASREARTRSSTPE